MIYNDKSQEEIQASLDQFINLYKERTGKDPNIQDIRAKIMDLARQKEEAMFQNIFGTYTSNSLLTAASLLENKMNDNDDPKGNINLKVETKNLVASQDTKGQGLFSSNKSKKK